MPLQFQVAAMVKQKEAMEATGEAAVALIQQAGASAPRADGKGQMVNTVA